MIGEPHKLLAFLSQFFAEMALIIAQVGLSPTVALSDCREVTIGGNPTPRPAAL